MAAHALLTSGAKTWRSVACPKAELRLDLTLACGQSFRWRETADGHWTGVMGGRVWTLTQTDDTLWYHVYKKLDDRKQKAAAAPQQGSRDEEEAVLRDYFQLNVKLQDLYKRWGAADPHFQRIAGTFTGIRMLRQDPTECLFSFICTSNNHISRIQGMVERLCEALGDPLLQLDQTPYHNFPSLSALAGTGVEARLRDLGFGYRARFVHQSARQILEERGSNWLDSLRGVLYPQARDALRTLPGVGTKVADCVCLMSLDKAEAVPVDTHVWQIAKRDYKYAAGKEPKSITDKLHKDIGDFFRHLWGPHAGWAQSVLFCADLKKFQRLKEEQTQLKRPKKEEDEESPVTKTTVKAEPNGTKRNRKHKNQVKEEKVD